MSAQTARLRHSDSVCDSKDRPSFKQGRRALVYQLHSCRELQRERDDLQPVLPCRDAVCALCEKVVALVLGVPLERMRARTRQSAEIALARQIAMYLAHTSFSLPLTEVGFYFGRDRSTVSHACVVVEEKRDQLAFEVMVAQLESLLGDARAALVLANLAGGER